MMHKTTRFFWKLNTLQNGVYLSNLVFLQLVNLCYALGQVLSVVVSWAVMLCGSVGGYQHFGENW
jgi:hypothetical protein